MRVVLLALALLGMAVPALAQTNASVGRNTVTAPTSSTLGGYVDGSGNLQAVSPTTPMPVTNSPSGTQDVNLSKVAGATVATGHGAAAGALRVELPTDGTGVVGLNAGTAIVGNVGIDQTTAGTTNGVVVNSSALPAGAATSALQTTGNTSTSAISAASGTTADSAYAGSGTSTIIAGLKGIYNKAAGTLTVSSVPSSSPTAGISPSIAGSSSSNTVVKASAGNLYGAYVTTGATAGYLMVFNAVSAPGNGATTAGIASGNLQGCIVAPSNTTTSISYIGAPPEVFTTGVTLVFSSTGCGTLTASATAYLHGSAF